MKKLNLTSLGLSNDELLTRAQMRNLHAGDGPGGSNGNPCPNYCEPMGGEIWCSGQIDGVATAMQGNCNTYPYDPNMHNICINETNGSFWC